MINTKTCLFSLLIAALLGLSHTPIQAKENAISFLAFGDFGTGSKMQYQVAEAMQKKCQHSGCDFVITLGDNIYNNGVQSVSDSQFQSKFEKPYAQLPYRFHMVLGNHDYRGNIQAQIDYTQKSKKWYLPAKYYTFKTGHSSFFALDTNDPNPEQVRFLTSGLKNAHTPWKIAFGHHPRHSNGYYKNSQSAGQIKLLDSMCSQVALYLSGHEHNQQHIQKGCAIDYLIVGSAAGMRAGASGPGTQFYRPGYGFAWVKVSEQEIYFELLDENAKVHYSHKIKRLINR